MNVPYSVVTRALTCRIGGAPFSGCLPAFSRRWLSELSVPLAGFLEAELFGGWLFEPLAPSTKDGKMNVPFSVEVRIMPGGIKLISPSGRSPEFDPLVGRGPL
jgi:hypothetical protein